MSEQKIVGYRAPIAIGVLDDPKAFGAIAAHLLTGARIEADKACEGRTYTIDRMRITIGKYEQPFYNEGDPDFIHNMLTAMLELRITIAN